MSAMLLFSGETVHSFVMRCLEIEQKILLFSGKPHDLCYTTQFVNKRFLRTLEKKIRSNFITQDIKHLQRVDVCDEDLLATVIRLAAKKPLGLRKMILYQN